MTALSVRGMLVVAQIAVSFALVVAAGLFLHTNVAQQLPLGFVPEPLLVAELNLQAGGGPPRSAVRASSVCAMRRRPFQESDRLVSSVRLLTGGGWSPAWSPSAMEPCPHPARSLAERHDARLVRDDGHPLRSGRDFEAGDRVGSPGCHRERNVRAPVSAGRAADRGAGVPWDSSPTHATRSSAWSAIPSTRRRARACWPRCMCHGAAQAI